MKSTITDVAKRAGVSISTVSRVLKKNYSVSDKRKELVYSAVKDLNYTPNFIASSLKSKQLNLLGVILPSLNNNVIMSIASAIASVAKRSGYLTLFAYSENSEEIERDLLNLFRSSFVDAIIVATVMKDDAEFRKLQAMNIPVVLFDRYVGSGIDWVGEDGYTASYELTRFMIDKGHRRIAFLKGKDDLTISIERFEGYEKAMQAAGLELDPELQQPCDFREEKAYDAVHSLLTKLKRQEYPTAIFSANSSMAKGAINAILEHGLRIPSDISIASYGDLDLPKSARPRITCIRQNAKEIGRLINELVLRRIEEKRRKIKHAPPVRTIVPVTFFEGDSIMDLNHARTKSSVDEGILPV